MPITNSFSSTKLSELQLEEDSPFYTNRDQFLYLHLVYLLPDGIQEESSR
jgi:hypothetical protein